MVDTHLTGTAELSDRAREILRRAETPADVNGQVGAQPSPDDEVLNILQDAIDRARDHLTAIRDMLEHIAATPPR